MFQRSGLWLVLFACWCEASGDCNVAFDRHSSVEVAVTGSDCLRHDIEFGINVINSSRYYRHSAEFCHVPHLLCKVERDFLYDYTGLRVPFRFDCRDHDSVIPCHKLNQTCSPWGGFDYDYYDCVPDRWISCDRHAANVKSSLEWFSPPLPIIDEEYDTHGFIIASIRRAAKRARTHRCEDDVTVDAHGMFPGFVEDYKTQCADYVIFELGARWGTWGFRALSLVRTMYPNMRARAVFWEPDDTFVSGIREVAEANEFTNYKVLHQFFDPRTLYAVAAGSTLIDYMDMDIQRAELMVCDPFVVDIIIAKVRFLNIATHDKYIHSSLLTCLSTVPELDVLMEVPYGHMGCCNPELIRNNLRDWPRVRKRKLFHDSPRGPISNWDGAIVVQNRAI